MRTVTHSAFLVAAVATLSAPPLPGHTAAAPSPTRLFAALKVGDGAKVKALLARGVSANSRDEKGTTALSRALQSDFVNVATVQALLKAGADVNARNRDRSTPVTSAAALSPPYLQLLLQRGGKVELADEDGATPLHVACYADKTANVRLLLHKGANVKARTQGGLTPLLFAAGAAVDPEIIRLLLQYGASIAERNKLGDTPAATTAQRQDVPGILIALLDAGADPNGRSGAGVPLVALAAGAPSPMEVRVLLMRGANPNAADPRGGTALMKAAASGSVVDSGRCAELLLRAGADEKARDRSGRTALTIAEASANDDVAQLVRGGKAALPPLGTPEEQLRRGVIEEDWVLVAEQLRAGVSPNAVDPETGDPMLILSIREYPNTEVFQRLLKGGADANGRSKQGETALMVAARTVLVEHVRLLLAYKADVNVRDSEGNTPLMAARYGENPDIIRMIQKAGARE